MTRKFRAGWQRPVIVNTRYVDLYYTLKLLGPVVAGLIAGFLLRGENIVMWFIILAGSWLSCTRFLVDWCGEAASGENPVGTSRCS